jgi:hypothetical protein
VWRVMQLDCRAQDRLLETPVDLQPDLWKRNAAKIRNINQAADVDALLDLTPMATGLAGCAWPKRIREFGADAADRIVTRLGSDWMRVHAKQRAGIQEQFVGVVPLVTEVLWGPEAAKADAMWALTTGIGYRLGRSALHGGLMEGGETEGSQRSQIEAFVDRIFAYSQEDVEHHVEAFYSHDATRLLSLAQGHGRQH